MHERFLRNIAIKSYDRLSLEIFKPLVKLRERRGMAGHFRLARAGITLVERPIIHHLSAIPLTHSSTISR